jgi:single-stranded DNA-specific DHH superfamily exonuclease
MDDQMLEHFGETIDSIIEDNDEEGYGLTPAEIQELKDEYGLEAEEIKETVS